VSDMQDWIEKKKRKIAEKEEERLERFAYAYEVRRQKREYASAYCPVCHRPIAEKLARTVYDVPLYDARRGDYYCTCKREVNSQMRRFFLVCVCFNTSTKIPMCQFPNGLITSGVRITTGKPSDTWETRRDEATRAFFESMEDLENTLAQQTIVHDWSIEWIDEEVSSHGPLLESEGLAVAIDRTDDCSVCSPAPQ
jgi:hypothetical protein